MTQQAPQSLNKLLNDARKHAQRSDGKRMVALALAASTRLSAAAAETVLDSPFSSAKIGLKDKAGMRAFKKSLAMLMPHKGAAIAKIPDESGLTPAEIASFVTKLLHVERAKPEPLRGAPAVYVKSQSAESRTKCANVLGKAFAEKASDRMVQAMQIRLAAGPREAAVATEQAMIFEFDAPELPAVTAGLGTGGAARESLLITRGARSQRVVSMRETFYRLVSPMRAEIERRIGSAAGSFRESAMDLGSASDVCWLNGTMRAVAAPGQVADIAADPSVKRIGIPQALERELNVTGKTVRAISFRKNHGLTGKDILVAVIDGEVDASHPALAGRVMLKQNFTKEPWGKPDGHGTGVAGIIGSANKPLLGMAPEAMIANYKVFATNPADQGAEFDATLAVQQAVEDGVAVANCSWGIGLATDGSSRAARAFDRAWGLGLILVKSAGNRGPGSATLTSPADARGVIVVGATDRKGKRLEAYSSRGPGTAKAGPDFLAPGASPTDDMMSLSPGGGTGGIGFGTSYAAPHIAGLIALLLEQDPSATPDQVKAALIAKGSPLTPNPASDCGAGLILI